MNSKKAKITLHEAIQFVLQHNCPMTAVEIAQEINHRELYTQEDGSPATADQIGRRIAKHPELFAICLK